MARTTTKAPRATQSPRAPKAHDPEREITDRIIAAIEAGTAPWRRPWTGGGGCPFPLRATGERYRGINVLSLWLEASDRGYASPFWMTYRQAAELGGQVRAGSKSTLVVKFGMLDRPGEEGRAGGDDGGRGGGQGAPSPEGQGGRDGTDSRDGRRPYLKAYHVFNADQVDGLPAEYVREAGEAVDLGTQPDEGLEAYFANLGARVETSPDPRAYYHPSRDLIHLPPIATFHTAQGYYETLGHEAVHYAERRTMPHGGREGLLGIAAPCGRPA